MYFTVADGMRPAPLTHNPMNALVMPRPIAWVSTQDAAGVRNLAPYSYFNLVAAEPPFVVFAPNAGAPGTAKDTYRNLCDIPEFVVSLVGEHDLQPMNASSKAFPREVDEFAACGITTVESRLVRPPRVASALAAMECRVHQIVDLPVTPDGRQNHVVIGAVVGVYLDDSLLVDGRVDEQRLHPLARLGYMNYGTLGQVFECPRPE